MFLKRGQATEKQNENSKRGSEGGKKRKRIRGQNYFRLPLLSDSKKNSTSVRKAHKFHGEQSKAVDACVGEQLRAFELQKLL